MEIKKDEFGPEMIVKVYDPKIGMEGFLVVHNTALGPGKGGIRMTPNITEEEVYRLASTMTWKNSLAGIPFGGAKAGIVWNGGTEELKKQFVQSFARSIKLLTPKKYIAGPDVNTGEKEMTWFVDATGNWRSATGKPANLCMKIFGGEGEKCGIPHEFGSTGWGVAQSTKAVADALGLDFNGIKVSIHGFGNVGTFTYKFLTEMGAKVVALADHTGVIHSEDGLDGKKIKDMVREGKHISSYPGLKKLSPEDFWKIPVDIMIPASVTDVINENNKKDIKAKIIIEAANIPMREEIEQELLGKGIFILPDFVANAGGVISSYAEYRGYNPKRMFEIVKNRITKATNSIVKKSLKKKENPRKIAMEIARERVVKAMRNRKEK